jgi:DNA repair protein SbcC/Rad50
MILKSIRLRGFRGLRGLGIPEVYLDLTALPEEGLVAICGGNGAGKTTLLDNMHPYRIQPFKIRKAKDWTAGSFNFYDQCHGADASKELIFTMGAHDYRSLVLIDADRRKQEAYLYRWDGGHWASHGSSDGKVKTYDEEIEKLCGTPQMFFTSVFRCQGAQNISDYKRSAIMSIISELLNIDHIKEQSEKSRMVVTGLSSSLSLLRDRVSALTLEAVAATELLDSIALQETELSTHRLGLGSARNDLGEVRQLVTGYREKIAAQDSEMERKGLVERSFFDERDRKQTAENEYSNSLLGFDRRAAALKTELEGWQANHATRTSRLDQDARADLEAISRRCTAASEAHTLWLSHPETGIEGRIARATRIVGGADKIRAQVPIEETLQAALVANKALLPSLTLVQQAAFQADSKHAQDLKFLKLSLGDCQKSAENLKGIDCTPNESGWVKPGCRLISLAVSDRDRIAKIEGEIAAAEADTSAHDALVKAYDDMLSCREAISSDEASLLEVQKFTRLVPELETAEANLLLWNKEVADRAAQLVSDLASLESERSHRAALFTSDQAMLEGLRTERLAKHVTDMESVETDRAQAMAKWVVDAEAFDTRLAEFRQKVAAFPPATLDLQELLRAAVTKEAAGLAAVEGFDKQIREIELEITAQRTKLQAAQLKGSELEALQPQLKHYAACIARFSLLQRACSNDGIISLELDDAAPSIAALVNDLLRACYGSRFTVRMDTQSEKQNGDMKEEFDIIVFDADSGDERSISEMSGGQTTIIEDAITRGICLYNIHRSDRIYGTLYSDERDGALDADRKLEFLRVKREALRVGTHSREFFISQTPDLVEMADARIVLAPGGVRIT